MSDGDPTHQKQPWRPWLRRLGPALGAMLFAAALLMVWRQRSSVAQALDAIENMSGSDLTMHAGVLLGTVVANIVCSAVMFNLIMRRYGRVGWLEMHALIAASTLLNYVPLRPGLLGRVAYHRLYNGIAVTHSVAAIVRAIVLSFVSVAALALVVSAAVNLNLEAWRLAFVPLVVMAAAACMAAMFGGWRATSPLILAAAVRYVDLLATALRYHAAFALIGSPIDFQQASAFACIAVVASMVPFLSNGLGLREWAIGLAAPILAASQLELAMTADLLNRAAEIVVIVPFGVAGLVYLMRLRRRRAEPGSLQATRA